MAKIDKVQEVDIRMLKPYEKNAKIHNQSQIRKIADSIEEFGFLNPILIDNDFNVIAGHGRLEASKFLNMDKVPCINIEGLTEQQRRAYILADNKLGELAEWDFDLVISELNDLKLDNFDIDLTGFDLENLLDQEKDDDTKDRKDLSNDITNTFEIVIECDNEEQQEELYNKLVSEGYTCRVLTL